VSLIFPKHGNLTLARHGLKQCFLYEMSYFHNLVVSQPNGTIKFPEKVKNFLEDILINLS